MSSLFDREYLHDAAVAERIGVTKKTIGEYLSSGRMPEPDLVFLKHNLWLPETIDAWRRQEGKTGRLKIARRHKVKPKSVSGPRVPKLVTSKPKRKRRVASVVSEQIAGQVAAALRSQGVHCTSDDVHELAVDERELEYERDVLRRRIRAKLKSV